MVSPQLQSHPQAVSWVDLTTRTQKFQPCPLRVTHLPCQKGLSIPSSPGLWLEKTKPPVRGARLFKIWLRSVPSPLYHATSLGNAWYIPHVQLEKGPKGSQPLSYPLNVPTPWFPCPSGPQSASTSCFSSPSSSLLQFIELLLHAWNPNAITYYHSHFTDGDTEVTWVEGRSEACLCCPYVFKWKDF